MPIEKITAGTLHKFCINCGKRHIININTLKVGKKMGATDAEQIVDIIIMPPCPTCGSVENMIRTTMDPPSGREANFAHTHKAQVNKLHQHLCAQDQFDDPDIKTKWENESQDKKAKHVAANLDGDLATKGMPKAFLDLIAAGNT